MLSYEETVRFHGHSGPFLAIGYRVGQVACERLEPKGLMDISCIVKIPIKTPFNCIVDGIQCSTNCTFGKGNIELKPSEGDIEILFRDKTGRKIKMKVLPEIIEYALNCEEMEECAEKLLQKSIDEILKFLKE